MSLTLSYSSSNLLLGCEQRYAHYKVLKTEKDPDFEDNYTAFNIGKAFHYILEMSLHKKPESIAPLLETVKEDYMLTDDQVALVHGMVLKYLRGTKDDGLECVHCEFEIKHEVLYGFIDLISKDAEGNWIIFDLKTASAIYDTTIKKLPQNIQLNLYAYFAPEIALNLGLDLDKFQGCGYRVVTKPRIKRKKTEGYNDYVLRVADSAKFHDYFVPINNMKPDQVFKRHTQLHSRAMELHEGAEPRKNFNYCDSYFRPCEYWSQCHGKCYSEIEVIDRAT